MNRSIATLLLLFGLVLLTNRAQSVTCPDVTVNSGLVDTLKVGFGGRVAEIRGRIQIDAAGSDCDGTFDTETKSVWVRLQ